MYLAFLSEIVAVSGQFLYQAGYLSAWNQCYLMGGYIWGRVRHRSYLKGFPHPTLLLF